MMVFPQRFFAVILPIVGFTKLFTSKPSEAAAVRLIKAEGLHGETLEAISPWSRSLYQLDTELRAMFLNGSRTICISATGFIDTLSDRLDVSKF